MREIILIKGQRAFVDEQDFQLVSKYRWHLSSTGYVRSGIYPNDSPTSLHHLIVGNPMPGFVVDHINGNRLDNRRNNLRVVSIANNSRNRNRSKRNKSGVTGVYLFRDTNGKRTEKWRACISVKGKYIGLGLYATIEEAVDARRKAEKKYGFVCR
jgi:hypothetical protein